MDRIIKNISEIESGSVKIMDDANAKKSTIFSRIQEETAAYENTVEAKTNARIAELRAKLEKNMHEKLEEQNAIANAALQALTLHYEQNHEAYTARIFKEMTGV